MYDGAIPLSRNVKKNSTQKRISKHVKFAQGNKDAMRRLRELVIKPIITSVGIIMTYSLLTDCFETSVVVRQLGVSIGYVEKVVKGKDILIARGREKDII
jgi:hypothetical protein